MFKTIQNAPCVIGVNLAGDGTPVAIPFHAITYIRPSETDGTSIYLIGDEGSIEVLQTFNQVLSKLKTNPIAE